MDVSCFFKCGFEEFLGEYGYDLFIICLLGDSYLEFMKLRVCYGGRGMEFCLRDILIYFVMIWRICFNFLVELMKIVGKSLSVVR